MKSLIAAGCTATAITSSSFQVTQNSEFMNEMQSSQYLTVCSLLQPSSEPLEHAITARAAEELSSTGLDCKIWSQTSELTYKFTQHSLTVRLPSSITLVKRYYNRLL